MNLQLRAAGEQDILEIQQLGDRIWRQHYPDIIGPEQMEYMLNKLYSPDALKEQMAEGQQFFLVWVDGKPMGFVAISPKSETEYFIHKFYLDTSKHRKGIGTLVFNELLAIYPDMHTIKLQVNRQNYKPINFYFKLGFVIERVADFDIGNGYFMNDFVMVWVKRAS